MKLEFPSIRLTAFAYMLRPMIRMVLGASHTFQECSEVMKAVFVEVAQEELEKGGEKQNVSRISMVTGLQRPDVKRFLVQEGSSEAEKRPVSLLIRLASYWSTHPDYTTRAKKPRVLTYRGEENEFVQLCSEVSKSIVPGTALFELQRIGAVERTPRGLKLVNAEVRLDEDEPARFEILGRGVNALIHSSLQNLAFLEGEESQPKSKNLYLMTEYDNLYVEDIPKLRSWMLKKGREVHREARAFFSKSDEDTAAKRSNAPAGGRIRFGMFGVTYPTEPPKD